MTSLIWRHPFIGMSSSSSRELHLFKVGIWFPATSCCCRGCCSCLHRRCIVVKIHVCGIPNSTRGIHETIPVDHGHGVPGNWDLGMMPHVRMRRVLLSWSRWELQMHGWLGTGAHFTCRLLHVVFMIIGVEWHWWLVGTRCGGFSGQCRRRRP